MKIYGKQIKREHLIHVRLGALKTNMKFPNSQQSSDKANYVKTELRAELSWNKIQYTLP